jgi:hypothetical protein
MGDDNAVAGNSRKMGGKMLDSGNQGGTAFAIWGDKLRGVGGPRIQRRTR